MNKNPIVEMLANFARFYSQKPQWSKNYTQQVKQVRSCHSRIYGGVKKSYYTVETKSGLIFNMVFNEEELLWEMEPPYPFAHHVVDNILVWVKRHKYLPSHAHRIVPCRFEVIPKEYLDKKNFKTESALIDRMQPFRFQSGKMISTQVIRVVTKYLENMIITKRLHYVVETDAHRFFHLVYILDESDWRLIQEVDEELFYT